MELASKVAFVLWLRHVMGSQNKKLHLSEAHAICCRKRRWIPRLPRFPTRKRGCTLAERSQKTILKPSQRH